MPVEHPPHPVWNGYGTLRMGHEGHDEWLARSPDEPARVVASVVDQTNPGSRDWVANPAPTSPNYRQSLNGKFAAAPGSGKNHADAAKDADTFHAAFEEKYARASPRPCRAASPPCLCCGGPCCAAPCSRVRRRWVGAAVRDGRSGACVASRVALLTVRREVKRKEAPPVHTHARHTHARALWHCAPAHTGAVRPPSALCVEPATARACSQHSVGRIHQASPAAGPPAKKPKNPTPVQKSITSMFPRVKSELVSTLEAI